MKHFCQSLFSSFVITLCLTFAVSAQIKLTPHKISLQNGSKFDLNLPADYEISPAVEGLNRVRFFAKAPDGRIFVTDMLNLTDNRKGTIYILDQWNAGSGKFGKVTKYLTNLRNPNSVQFFTDEIGQDWLYLAETDKLTRRKFTRGEATPTDKNPQTLATFPDYGLSYKYGGWHLTRSIAISPDAPHKIYVSVGSSCNACVEKEAVRASVIEMNPDGSDQREYATGLRNAVGLKFVWKTLFATNQGADHLGLQRPDETFFNVKANADYGWPQCYAANGKFVADPKYNTGKNCAKSPAPYSFFEAHGSALGFEYFDKDAPDANLKSAFLVALHGSTNKNIGHGYKLVVARQGKKNQDFLTGFLNGKTVNGRPCDIFKMSDDSFLVTDDNKGVIYYVRRKA